MRKCKIILFVCLAALSIAIPLLSQEKFELIPNKSPNELRILKLLVVADQIYQKQVPNWKEEITNAVNTASRALDSQVGIQLKIVEFKNWERKAIGDSHYSTVGGELIKTFPRTKETDFDVIIGFTSHYLELPAWTYEYDGCILITNKKEIVTLDKYKDVKIKTYYLLSPAKRKNGFPHLILHEIGHIFGCDHCQDNTCAMSVNGYSMKFCEKCVQTVKKWKWREFSNPQSEKNK